MTRFLLLPLLALACMAAGEADPAPAAALPPAAQTVLDRLAKAEAKIDADAAKARSGERQKAIKELDKVQVTTTKAGDLDAAVALKARIDELRAADEVDTAALLGESAPASKDPAKLAIGSWNVVKTNGVAGQIELNPEKTARATAGPFVITGIWQIEKDRVVILWSGNPSRWERLGFEGADRLVGDSHDAGKGGIAMTRLPKPAPAGK